MAHSRLHKVLLVSSMLLILLISDLQRVASKDGEEAPNFTKMRVKVGSHCTCITFLALGDGPSTCPK